MKKTKTFDISRHLSWNNSPEKLISKKQLAEQLGISIRTVDNWIKHDFLPSPITRNNRVIGWFASWLDEWKNNLKR